MPPLTSHNPVMYDAAPLSPIPFDRNADALPAAEGRLRVEAGAADLGAPWFPTGHLFTAVADGKRTRDLLATLNAQAHLVDDLLAACAAGGATLPPALQLAFQRSAETLAAMQAGAPPRA